MTAPRTSTRLSSPLTHTHTHTHSLSHSHTHSLSRTHSHTHSLAALNEYQDQYVHDRTAYLDAASPHTLSHSLTLTHTLPHTLTHTHTLSHTLSLAALNEYQDQYVHDRTAYLDAAEAMQKATGPYKVRVG